MAGTSEGHSRAACEGEGSGKYFYLLKNSSLHSRTLSGQSFDKSCRLKRLILHFDSLTSIVSYSIQPPTALVPVPDSPLMKTVKSAGALTGGSNLLVPHLSVISSQVSAQSLSLDSVVPIPPLLR